MFHIDVIAGFVTFSSIGHCGDDTMEEAVDCFQKFFPPGDELDGRVASAAMPTVRPERTDCYRIVETTRKLAG